MTRATEQVIQESIEQHSDDLKMPDHIRVADTTRWGYTRKNGVIVFNWQLIVLPFNLAEYIVIHELVHLSALNHQKRFHYRLSRIIPDYRLRHKALQKYLAVEPKFMQITV